MHCGFFGHIGTKNQQDKVSRYLGSVVKVVSFRIKDFHSKAEDATLLNRSDRFLFLVFHAIYFCMLI